MPNFERCHGQHGFDLGWAVFQVIEGRQGSWSFAADDRLAVFVRAEMCGTARVTPSQGNLRPVHHGATQALIDLPGTLSMRELT